MEELFADHGLAVEEGPVRAVEIFQEELAAFSADLRVAPRDGAAGERDLAVGVAADGDDVISQLGGLGDVLAGGVQQPEAGATGDGLVGTLVEKADDEGVVVLARGTGSGVEGAAAVLAEAALFVVHSIAARTACHSVKDSHRILGTATVVVNRADVTSDLNDPLRLQDAGGEAASMEGGLRGESSRSGFDEAGDGARDRLRLEA